MGTARDHLVYSSSYLRDILAQQLQICFGARHTIVSLERRLSDKRSSYALEELDVLLDDGTALQLIFKDVSRHGLLPDARYAKPAFLFNPLREIETYRTILVSDFFRTAVCYGIYTDDQAQQYWLFLERVSGQELYQVGFPVWQRVATWLAAMHTHFQSRPLNQAQTRQLLRYDGKFYRRWVVQAERFLSHPQSTQPREARTAIAWLAKRYHHIIEQLATLPLTFIHGEFYASNVIVQELEGELRICPIDWEMAAIGPGLIDLAALTSGSWTPAEKRLMALAYYTELASSSQLLPTLDTFFVALDCCRLHLAVQWLGWSLKWSAPPEHTHNWLDEAIHLAEQLKI